MKECSQKEILNREQFYLDNTKCTNREYGYNLALSATSAMKGRTATEETKLKSKNTKIKNGTYRKPLSPEHIEILRKNRHITTEETKNIQRQSRLKWQETHNNPFLGKKHTPEALEKMRNKEVSDNTKHLMSMAKLGKPNPFSEEHKINLAKSTKKALAKAVLCDNTIKFESINDAVKYIGVHRRGLIIDCLKGRRQYAYGHTWKYIYLKHVHRLITTVI